MSSICKIIHLQAILINPVFEYYFSIERVQSIAEHSVYSIPNNSHKLENHTIPINCNKCNTYKMINKSLIMCFSHFQKSYGSEIL